MTSARRITLPCRGRVLLLGSSPLRWSLRVFWPFGDPTKNIPSRVVFAMQINLARKS